MYISWASPFVPEMAIDSQFLISPLVKRRHLPSYGLRQGTIISVVSLFTENYLVTKQDMYMNNEETWVGVQVNGIPTRQTLDCRPCISGHCVCFEPVALPPSTWWKSVGTTVSIELSEIFKWNE
jgi:hypothetical protein